MVAPVGSWPTVAPYVAPGRLLNSSLNAKPKLAGKPAALTLRFALSGALAPGETVTCYLPGFGAGLATINPLDANVTLAGRPAARRTRDEGNVTAKWVASGEALVLMFAAAVPAATEVVVHVAKENGIALPAAGLAPGVAGRDGAAYALDDAPRIATDAVSAPIAAPGLRVGVLPTIAAFVDSELEYLSLIHI